MTEGYKRAIVLAAGKGTRMGPLSDHTPKPLTMVSGRTLLDRILDHLKMSGVEKTVVNIHHLADVLEKHLGPCIADKSVTLSDERSELLETGGGVKKALPSLGNDPFFVINGDALWVDGQHNNLNAMKAAFSPDEMDILLLLAPKDGCLGYDGAGDFLGAEEEGLFKLTFRGDAGTAPYVFAGVQITKPQLYADTPDGPWSNVELFRKAAMQGRLYGLLIDGYWMHVGTPDAITEAEAKLQELGAR